MDTEAQMKEVSAALKEDAGEAPKDQPGTSEGEASTSQGDNVVLVSHMSYTPFIV